MMGGIVFITGTFDLDNSGENRMAEKNDCYEAPRHTVPPPLISVSGTHREMGQQIGEGRRENVKHSIENARRLLEEAFRELKLSWEGAQKQARQYLPFAQQRYPQYVEELLGIAEGANVRFDELLVLNVIEELTMDRLDLTHCTSMAVNDQRTANGHVLAAHNEDWLSENEDDVFVIHARPKDEPPYLAMTYGGLLANVGFNAHGIAQLINTVYPNDTRPGIPRLFVSRAALAASSPGEAIERAMVPQRAAGYNHLIAHESGELYNVEASAQRFALLYPENGTVAHTNHYLAENMQAIESRPETLAFSRVRYGRARRLLDQTEKHTVESLQAIQRDHVNYPKSICMHDENIGSIDGEKTINALVIDLTGREMHIAWGNPCRNEYHCYRMEG
jgi:isopenicillin-N N-acyltransferase-like protein